MSAQTIDPRAPFEELALPEGLQVGEYILEDKLGEGGFGSVYRARHPLIGKLAAIKVLSRKYSADPDIVSRFVSEARAVNQIRHRNIVDIFAFGQLEDGRSYFVMELLDGVPLDAHIREQGGLPIDEALPILRAIARALDAAHAKGIAHRDLKPENIILARGDEGEMFPKLLDFGIAKLVGDNGFSTKHKTRTGTPIGTPFYMSPEQARGEAIDHRTDIYSFGCVAYELLTGKVPFDGDNHLAIMLSQCSDEPIAPSIRAAGNPELPPLPASVDTVVAWLMQKDPAARPASLAIAIQALEEAAGIPPSRPTPFPSRATPVPRASSHPGRTTSPSQRGGQTAFAQTVAGDASGAVVVERAETPVSKRRGFALVAGALLVAGAAAAAAVVIVTRPPAAPAVAPEAAQPEPVAPSSPPPALVTIRIDGPPEGTEVFGPSGPVGRAPGDIQLVRGDVELQLTLQAEGHETKTIKVSPARSGSVTVMLEPKQVAVEAPPPATPTKLTTKPTRPTTKPITKPITKSNPGGSGTPPKPDPWTSRN